MGMKPSHQVADPDELMTWTDSAIGSFIHLADHVDDYDVDDISGKRLDWSQTMYDHLGEVLTLRRQGKLAQRQSDRCRAIEHKVRDLTQQLDDLGWVILAAVKEVLRL